MTLLESGGRALHYEMGSLSCPWVEPRSTLCGYTYEPVWWVKCSAGEVLGGIFSPFCMLSLHLGLFLARGKIFRLFRLQSQGFVDSAKLDG